MLPISFSGKNKIKSSIISTTSHMPYQPSRTDWDDRRRLFDCSTETWSSEHERNEMKRKNNIDRHWGSCLLKDLV